MSAMTSFSPSYGTTVPGAAAAPKRESLFQRFFDRMVEARMRKAAEYIKQHSHLIPRELDEAGWKITERSEGSLPFIR